jgi:hypothetical protein
MDLSLSRRKRERAIAEEVADAFLHATDATELAPPEKLAHHFAFVFERLGIMPDDAAVSSPALRLEGDIAARARAR